MSLIPIVGKAEQGGGHYDAEAEAALESAQAKGVILMIVGGRYGSGFVVKATAEVQQTLPSLLRQIADSIDGGRQ